MPDLALPRMKPGRLRYLAQPGYDRDLIPWPTLEPGHLCRPSDDEVQEMAAWIYARLRSSHEEQLADLQRRVKLLREQLRATRDAAELAEHRFHTVLEEHSLARCEACASVVDEDEIHLVGDDSVPLCGACYEEEVTP